MCLLTFMHEGVTADIDHLEMGALNNPDGFGYAIHAGSRIVRGTGMNFDRVLSDFLRDRAVHSGPALFHSRITTHGGSTRDNCHPFQIGRDTDTVVGHNGMLPIDSKNGKSDTRIFAETLFPSWGGVATLNSVKMRRKLSKFAEGSKLVFLSANDDLKDDYVIINEDLGSWDKGVWWSNSSYKYNRYSYSGGGMYSSGWHKSATYTTTPSGVIVPVKDNGFNMVEDATFIDRDGTEIWGEMWTCSVCRHVEYINEDNIDEALNCPACDCCWYCTESRIVCECWFPPQYDTPRDWDNDIDERPAQPVLTKGGYDLMVDVDF